VDQDSIVSIATCYRLDGLGIKSRGGKTFHTRPDHPWGPHRFLYNGHWISLPGIKRPGCGTDHLPPFSTKVNERVELYIYFPPGLSWPILG